eukprot:185223-Karenia_brevis.AAC.3
MHDTAPGSGRSSSDETMSMSLDSEFEELERKAKQRGAKDIDTLRNRYWAAKREVKRTTRKNQQRHAALTADWAMQPAESASSTSDVVALGRAQPAPNSNDEMQRLMSHVYKASTLEVFCGSGKLSAHLAAEGLDALGIDHAHNKDRPVCMSVNIDLSTNAGQMAFWTLVEDKQPCYVHFAPPCGTASRARDIRRK